MTLYSKKLLRGVTAGVTTFAMVFQPQMILAGEVAPVVPAPVQPVVATSVVQQPSDVVLQEKGVLVGRIVDAQGAAVANTPVSLQLRGKEVTRVVSDAKGSFQAEGLHGGVYQVASAGHQGTYRLWAPRTAPPTASTGMSIVSQPVDVVRGQYGPGGGGGPFSSVGQWIAEHPIMTAAGVAAAIAVPIAVADDDDDPPASP